MFIYRDCIAQKLITVGKHQPKRRNLNLLFSPFIILFTNLHIFEKCNKFILVASQKYLKVMKNMFKVNKIKYL
jgi:hypothetical protein